jgi:hypothetical protein
VKQKHPSGLVGGIILILIGTWFLAVRLIPGLEDWTTFRFGWPVIIIGVAILLLIIGLVNRERAMAIPACIVGGIGGLLCWQNATGNWESWEYAWALIPGFVGAGILISGLLGGERDETLHGVRLIIISAILFAVFGSIAGALGAWGNLLWPCLLILAGLFLLFRPYLSSE